MDYTLYNDTELTALIRSENEAAFTELYTRHFKTLYTTAVNILRTPEIAKDIIQEVFASVWQNRGNLDIQFPRAYLQQAVRFQVLKAIRSGRVDEEFYQRLNYVSGGMIIENTFPFKEFKHTVDQLIESLPEDCRTTFRLSREQNLTYNQIAKELNVSVKTVEKKMSQSLRYLRMKLGGSEFLSE